MAVSVSTNELVCYILSQIMCTLGEVPNQSQGRVVGYLSVSTNTQAEPRLRAGCPRASHPAMGQEREPGAHGLFPTPECRAPTAWNSGLALPEALRAMKEGGAEGLVVFRLDRLARDLVLQETLLMKIRRLECQVYSTAGGEAGYLADDPEDPSRRLIRQILGAVSEYERSMIDLRLRSGRRHKKERGGYARALPVRLGGHRRRSRADRGTTGCATTDPSASSRRTFDPSDRREPQQGFGADQARRRPLASNLGRSHPPKSRWARLRAFPHFAPPPRWEGIRSEWLPPAHGSGSEGAHVVLSNRALSLPGDAARKSMLVGARRGLASEGLLIGLGRRPRWRRPKPRCRSTPMSPSPEATRSSRYDVQVGRAGLRAGLGAPTRAT